MLQVAPMALSLCIAVPIAAGVPFKYSCHCFTVRLTGDLLRGSRQIFLPIISIVNIDTATIHIWWLYTFLL